MIYNKPTGEGITEIRWIAPVERADGTPYGATDHAGYELGVESGQDIVPWVSVPAAYDITSWPVSELNLGAGLNSVYLRTVDADSRVSAWSNPLEIVGEVAVPKKPTGLSAF